MPIVMSRFVDGLLMSQLRCHSIFGHADVRVYSDVRALRPTRPYTEKREALTWMYNIRMGQNRYRQISPCKVQII